MNNTKQRCSQLHALLSQPAPKTAVVVKQPMAVVPPEPAMAPSAEATSIEQLRNQLKAFGSEWSRQ